MHVCSLEAVYVFHEFSPSFYLSLMAKNFEHVSACFFCNQEFLQIVITLSEWYLSSVQFASSKSEYL